ncbi:PREDICTED: pleckstrin-2-like [Acropora digitifera]|uniref:pleckstrin-2-like n=1 Tax=Acropora digitifera TaxID=70779 RepID=UPI00077A79B0|nr:PREDICTED: pleckstrin-2-like [Acropora digitifera]
MESKEPRKLIKEGFLVKKGHVRHNWKTRWFILYEEMLVYCKKKDVIMQISGEIPLHGCFLVSPCNEYTKKEGVFRLTTKENVEYLFQAADDNEREDWTTAIANAIRKLDIKYKQRNLEAVHEQINSGSAVQFSPTQVREIVEAMQDADAGIPLDSHMSSKDNKIVCGIKSALRLSSQTGFPEWDYSDDSSDSEDEIPSNQCEPIGGNVIKQGFLQKRGHVRHNWKTRIFILCSQPAILFYCRPAKASVPVGQVKLENIETKTISSEDVSSEFEQGNRKLMAGFTFLLRTRKGTKFILRAASEQDRMDWVQALQSVCTESS